VRDVPLRWKALAAVAVGTYMSTLDSSIVNVSLPTISGDFGIDIPLAQWVVLSYLITVAALLLPAGRLVDLIGRGRAYQAGLALFTLASAVCGAAPSSGALIGARALQGLGAALIMATGAALLVDTWPAQERGRVMGLSGMIVSIGLMSGPPLGGLISGTLGWRWIFYVNLPVGVVGVAIAVWALRGVRSPARQHTSFDIAGAASLAAFMLTLCLGLTLGPRNGWQEGGTIALLTAAPLFLVMFLVRQATARSPMLQLSLFRDRTFSSASAAALASFTGQFPVFLLLPFYLEGVLGYSEEATGLTILVVPLLTAILAPSMGRLSDRVGTRWPTVVGMLVRGTCYAFLMLLGVGASRTQILAPLAFLALGNAAFGPANQSALMGSVAPADRGLASGMASAMRSLGMVIGAAAGTAIAGARAVAARGGAGNAVLDAAARPEAFVQGYHASLVFSVCCAFTAAMISAVRPTQVAADGTEVPHLPMEPPGGGE
jgi:EmrB/QacA subfamily drug resistance transporter